MKTIAALPKISHKLSSLPMSWRPDMMRRESLKSRVCEWRELQPKLQKLKPLLSEARRLEKTELTLRQEIGEMLGKALAVVVDGRKLIHSIEERNNGMDYKSAWEEAMKILPARSRRKLEGLLKPKISIIHKLATE